MGNLLSSILPTTTDASGNTGVGVNVNISLTSASLVQLFIVGSALISVGVLGAIVFSLIKK